MSMDMKTTAQLLMLRQKELDEPLKALGEDTPETALERLLYRRPLLAPSMMRTGRVPQADKLAWVMGALGETRMRERSAKELVFDICAPNNAADLLHAMEQGTNLPGLDMRVVCSLHIALPLVMREDYSLHACILMGSRGVTLSLNRVNPDMAVAVNALMEYLFSNGPLGIPEGGEDKTRKPGLLVQLGDAWEVPVVAGFLGFLYGGYGALMQGLYNDTLLGMAAWLFGGLAVGFAFRMVGTLAK